MTKTLKDFLSEAADYHVIYATKTGKSDSASTTKSAAQQKVKRLNAKFGDGTYDYMHSSEWERKHGKIRIP
jgi:hypothetical protein